MRLLRLLVSLFPRAGFLVLMPEYKQEVIQLALRAPCALEDALAEISDARSADNSERFDCLVPAFPQPDISFGTVLAVPERASVFGCCVVADLRLVDNRLFAYLIKGRLNRSSLLLQLGVPDTTGLRVYLGHTLMQELGLYTFQEGLTISVAFTIGSCPVPSFLAVPIDVEEVQSSQDFKAIAVESLRFELSRTTVCPSLPRLTDLAVLGVECKAALVVTESVPRIPIPPGRPPGQRIVFVDQRPILRGITWLLVPGGLIDIEAFLEPLSQQAPTGYCAIVLPADATDLHHVRLSNGTLLTVTYVLTGPGGSSEQHSSDDSDMDSDSQDSQEPSADDTTTPVPDDAERAVEPSASTPPGRANAQKLLEEPTPTGALDLARLDALEFFAHEFGLPWRYAPAWHVQERLALMPPIPAADTEQPELVTVCVAIAVPGFELERLNLVVLLPTDVGSFLIEVQASRAQAQARRFPHLLPVLPQPDARWVLLVALPAWDPQVSVVVYDTRAWDGRVFAEQVPDFMDHHDALRKAGLSINADVDVHTALDPSIMLIGHDTRIFPGQPWAFRQDIAECCGIRSDVVQILPARYLMQGFTVIWTRGVVDLAVLTADIGEFTPLFWEVLIITAPGALPAAEGRIQAEAGQVFTAVYRPQSIDEAMDPVQVAPGYSEAPASEGGLAASGVPTGDVAASSPAHGVVPVSREDEMSHDTSAEGDVTLTADGPPAPRLHFLILAPEYSPDLVSLPADVPLSVEDALDQVSPLREPTSSYRFPRLQPVPMQPVTSFACLLALPAWEVTGVPILIVSYALPFRVMAAVTGALLASDDILRLIGAPEDGTAQVFFSDVPWVLPAGRQVRVQPGDLFTIFPSDQPRIPPVALQALLASDEGWHYDPVLPGPFVGAVWVLTTTDHLRVPYDHRPDLGLPEAVSQLVGVAREDLTFLPAHPPIQDEVPYLLDQRPVLLDLVWADKEAEASHRRSETDRPHRSPDELDLAGLVDGPTVLDSVLASEKRKAWFNAVALIETLEEHFAVADPAPPPLAPAAMLPLPIPLSEAVPLSDFQSQALSLRDVLPGMPGSQRPEELLDWLDNDLRGLLSDPAVPHCKRPLFQSIRQWHSAATGLEPGSIAVYTDGSSTSGPRPAGLPGAWAISVWVVVGTSEYLLGYAADAHVPPSDERFVGAHDDTPLTCEQLALAWALAWVIQFGAALSLPTCLVYDCQAAGLGAFGLARAPGTGHAGGSSDLSMFVCLLRQLAHTRVPLTRRHVKAHAGCVANELCDELAKRARRNPAGRSGDILPVWMGLLYAHPLKAWAWLPASGSSDLPSLFSFESEASRLQASDPIGEQGPVLGRRAARPGRAPSEFCFCLITVNVLTLLDPSKGGVPHHTATQPGLRIVAKRELLKSQFLEARALLIGLQETRLQESATLPDGQFVMLHAAADDRGHYGVALWANTTVPYAHKGEAKWYLTRSHFTVVECQPRLLVVSVRAPHLSWTVVVAHAPSEPPAAKGSAAAFWRSCKKVLSRCARDTDVILLADANARVGGLVSDSVSSHGAEEESTTAPDFHQFLAEFSLQLPSTFDECHSGVCHTWVSPTGQCHRIDYIAVPLTWPLSGLSTFVWDTFESLQLRDDHFPLVLRAKMCCRTHDEGNACFTRAAVRPTKVTDPSHYIAGVEQALLAQPAGWGVGVDTHYAHLVQEWTRWGRTLCQTEERKPRQSYLSADTMQLVAWRKAWRSQLHIWKQWHRCRTLAFGLLLWRSSVHADMLGPAGVTGLCIWVDHFLLGIAQAALLIYRVGRYIKSSAKGDRAAYLAKLAHEVSLSDLKDPKLLYQRVRRAFPASRTGKRSQFCPLPAVYNANGDLAGSTQERQECWRMHFAAQEAGDLIEEEAYPAELRRQRSVVDRPGPIFDIRCVPTLADVEQTILGLPSGKATGNDGISAELLRVHAPISARLLASIYVKSALTIYEPIEFRGGSLIPLAKRASAAFSMDKFRSILVSSLPGKILHRQYRTVLIPPLQQVRGDLQAGALPGVSTEAIIMAARTFRDIMVHRQHAWSMTFFDVRAAYYRVLRQILVRTGDQEWALRKLLHELGVPPQALVELAAKMEGIGILADAGVPDHLCHLLADAMQGTWFRIDCGTALTLTRRGVRPGDCLADILFSFTFSAYLASTAAALHRAGIRTEMPTVAAQPPWEAPSGTTELSCASWADDFVHLAAQECHSSISARVVRTVEIFTGQADSIGMQLTFASDKTAAMLSQVSGQTVPVLEDSEGQFLPIVSPVTGTCHRLPVVSAYRHLGGIATVSGTPVPEIGFRHSLALKVVRPLRSRLFSAYGIPFSTRCLLLRSLVMSRYMFGGAALPLHAAVHKRLWAKHFVALWRVLWRRLPGEHCRHSYAVLGTAHAPTPPLALALSRAVLFRQLLTSGPSSLLHLLFVHWTESPRHAWLGMLLEDVQHVAQYLPEVRDVSASADWLCALVQRLRDSPQWWVGRVKAAIRCAVAEMQPWCASVRCQQPPDGSPQPPNGLTDVQGAVPASPVSGDLPFSCHWCQARFRLRKHLFVHLARSHQVFAPARHLAHGVTCVSCLRCFHTVSRHQQHLKRTDQCLLRTCLLVPCLSLEEVKLGEAGVVRTSRQLRKGDWGAYVVTEPALQASGPRQLTSRERLDLADEDLDLGLISRMFFPLFQAWVAEFVAGRSREGPRATSSSFWDVRPSSQKFHQNSMC
ncbi:unnamed protein product [Symbiodinium necroappetens]|uniref:RNase H type-1 domain-containing protein n=1 Tax=Symbiodinium necroappetens TaxID=1628268 RepID=A0A813A1W6_9DINO|nr:unnamed protein product [Symbiodinium necroappetens]